jgi:hypothetical protein
VKFVQNIDFNNVTSSGVPVPLVASAVASKQYVDDRVAGLDTKPGVRLATTAALPANNRVGNVLTANANGALPNIDGVAAVQMRTATPR